ADPNETILVDFDIAKEYGPDNTTTAVRRCSPGYGAPEQYGQGTSTLTDIYGLGATIYTLLTGTVPPDALHRMTILGAKGRDPLLPVNQIVPDVPKNVAEAIQNAMSLQAIDRFSTVEQFWQTFDTYSTMHEMPVPLETVSPSSSSQALAAAKNASGNTTTVPTKKLSPISVTQRRRRKAFPLIFALLALFVALGSAAALWALFGSHKGVLS